LHFNLLLPN